MKSISVKLAFQDEDFYDWFVEPKKVNNELPNLITRLLTAYANNNDLAFEIDQYLDKDSEPEVFEARELIMQAINQLNSLEANASAELEALSDTDNDFESADDDDIVITDGTGVADTENFVDTDGTGVADTENFVGTDDVWFENPVGTTADEFDRLADEVDRADADPSNAGADPLKADADPLKTGADPFETTTARGSGYSRKNTDDFDVPQMSASPEDNRHSEFESKVFGAIDVLTSQISQLASTVSTLATTKSTPEPNQYAPAQPMGFVGYGVPPYGYVNPAIYAGGYGIPQMPQAQMPQNPSTMGIPQVQAQMPQVQAQMGYGVVPTKPVEIASAEPIKPAEPVEVMSAEPIKPAEIEPKVAEIEPKVTDIEPKVTEITPKVTEITPKAAEITPKVAEIEPKVTEIEPKVTEIEPEKPTEPTKVVKPLITGTTDSEPEQEPITMGTTEQTVEQDMNDDSYEIPDFMEDMLSSLE